jgi:hypothetical protein
MQANPRNGAAVYIKRDLERIFGVTDDTIDSWRRSGKLPSPLPLPGRPRWSRETIDRLLCDSANQPSTPAPCTPRVSALLESLAPDLRGELIAFAAGLAA